jgi:PadR family transcriptional regulator PadR
MNEADKTSGLVQGTLDMLILRSLDLEPMHGYGIGVRLEQISRGALRVNAGSLFPAFRRLERDGQVKAAWRVTENGRRAKYYALTTRGRTTLAKATKDWQLQTRAISRVLNASLAKLS